MLFESEPCFPLAVRRLPSKLHDAFRGLLNTRISPYLKTKGFRRQGYAFLRSVGKNHQIVHPYVEHVGSTESRLLFGVSLGIISARLWWFETGRVRLTHLPLGTSWHLAESLPRLLPEVQRPSLGDWWSITSSRQVPPLATELEGALAVYGLPWLERHATDESLRDLYLTGGGGTELQILYRLAYLLSAIGPASKLDHTLTKLRTSFNGQSFERTAKEYADRIELLRKAR